MHKGEMVKALKSGLSAAILCQETCTDHIESDVHRLDAQGVSSTASEKKGTSYLKVAPLWRNASIGSRGATLSCILCQEYSHSYHIAEFTKTVRTGNDQCPRIVWSDYTNQDSRRPSLFLSWSVNTCMSYASYIFNRRSPYLNSSQPRTYVYLCRY